MLKLFLSFIVFSLFFNSCRKEAVNTPEAIKELTSTFPDCTCQPYINQYLWRNKTVYVLAFKGPTCDWRPGYYNESGEEFKMVSSYSFDNFLQEARFLNIIWTCKK
ncbi:MAG: hypothetical protein ABIO55_12200 [Ginsengibacter sp.]